QLPKPIVVLAQNLAARTLIHPKLLVDLFVEVLQKLLPGLLDALVDLDFHLSLKLIKIELNLLLSPALLVDIGDPFLEIDARTNTAQHFVAGAEDAAEQFELFVQ